MHLKDDVLRAFLDGGELDAQVRKNASEHLAGCPKCSAHLMELERTANRVSRHLQVLHPPSGELRPSPHTALLSFENRKEKTMKTFFRRPVWIAAGMAIILALALVFPPVRALAGSFLGLFRVQQIQVISFDPAALERYNNSDTNDILNTFFNENMTTTRQGEYATVNSREEAAATAGFTPRLPAEADVTSLGVQPGETIEINIDSAMMNAGLEGFGFPDVKIPSDLDGQKIVATIPTAVTAAFGDCPDEKGGTPSPACIGLIQLPAPSVTAPDSFPVVQLGEVILQLTGMSQEQAAQFSQSIDWSTTLILPIPTGSNTDTADIQVDGVSGTIVREHESGTYALIWVKDGVLYGMTGTGDSGPAFRLAETLQ